MKYVDYHFTTSKVYFGYYLSLSHCTIGVNQDDVFMLGFYKNFIPSLMNMYESVIKLIFKKNTFKQLRKFMEILKPNHVEPKAIHKPFMYSQVFFILLIFTNRKLLPAEKYKMPSIRFSDVE